MRTWAGGQIILHKTALSCSSWSLMFWNFCSPNSNHMSSFLHKSLDWQMSWQRHSCMFHKETRCFFSYLLHPKSAFLLDSPLKLTLLPINKYFFFGLSLYLDQITLYRDILNHIRSWVIFKVWLSYIDIDGYFISLFQGLRSYLLLYKC